MTKADLGVFRGRCYAARVAALHESPEPQFGFLVVSRPLMHGERW